MTLKVVCWLVAAVSPFLSGCDSCVGRIETYTGTTSTAQGTLRGFLEARKEGHTGEAFWREPIEGFPRMSDEVPINPTSWEAVLDKNGGSPAWAWHRFRIRSTTAAGIPIEKLWDFCLDDTTAGYRLVAAWAASDKSEADCAESPTWIKYPAPPKPSPQVQATGSEKMATYRDSATGLTSSQIGFRNRSLSLFGAEKAFRKACDSACSPGATVRDCDLCVCLGEKVDAAECDKLVGR